MLTGLATHGEVTQFGGLNGSETHWCLPEGASCLDMVGLGRVDLADQQRKSPRVKDRWCSGKPSACSPTDYRRDLQHVAGLPQDQLYHI